MTIRYKKPHWSLSPDAKPLDRLVAKAYLDAHNNVWLPTAYECFGGVWRCTER